MQEKSSSRNAWICLLTLCVLGLFYGVELYTVFVSKRNLNISFLLVPILIYFVNSQMLIENIQVETFNERPKSNGFWEKANTFFYEFFLVCSLVCSIVFIEMLVVDQTKGIISFTGHVLSGLNILSLSCLFFLKSFRRIIYYKISKANDFKWKEYIKHIFENDRVIEKKFSKIYQMSKIDVLEYG